MIFLQNWVHKNRPDHYHEYVSILISISKQMSPKSKIFRKKVICHVNSLSLSYGSVKMLNVSIKDTVTIQSLIDTGSTHCLISIESFKKLRIDKFRPISMIMKVAGSSLKDIIIGCIALTIKLLTDGPSPYSNDMTVGRLAKATFIRISLHTYSSNVTTLSKPNLENKQQNILNPRLLLTYIIVRSVYSVLGSYYLHWWPADSSRASLLVTRSLPSNKPLFSKRPNRFFESEQTVFLKTKQTVFIKANQSAFVKAKQYVFLKTNNPPF